MVQIILTAIECVFEKIIYLTKHQAERSEKLFKEYIEPIFQDLVIIHSNYLLIFNSALDDFYKKGKSVHEIIEDLKKNRREFDPVRVKLKSLIENPDWKLKPDHPISVFRNSMINYMPVGDLYKYRGTTVATSLINTLILSYEKDRSCSPCDSNIISMVEITKNLHSFGSPEKDVSTQVKNPGKLIESYIDQLNHNYSKVCEAYSMCKHRYLKL